MAKVIRKQVTKREVQRVIKDSSPAKSSSENSTKKDSSTVTTTPWNSSKTENSLISAAQKGRKIKEGLTMKKPERIEFLKGIILETAKNNKRFAQMKRSGWADKENIENTPAVFLEFMEYCIMETNKRMFTEVGKRYATASNGSTIEVKKVPVSGRVQPNPQDSTTKYLIFPKNELIIHDKIEKIDSILGNIDENDENIFIGENGIRYDIAAIKKYNSTSKDIVNPDKYIIDGDEKISTIEDTNEVEDDEEEYEEEITDDGEEETEDDNVTSDDGNEEEITDDRSEYEEEIEDDEEDDDFDFDEFDED